MSKPQEYKALRIPYGQAAWYISKLISMVLNRPISCIAKRDDFDFWATSSIGTEFSNAEIAELVAFVKGDPTMYGRAIPTDSNFSRSLDMSLGDALLKHSLNMEWENEFLDDEAIWVVGQWQGEPELEPKDGHLLFIDGRAIDTTQLMSKEDMMQALFTKGGTYAVLVNLFDSLNQRLGIELYWHYPICDEYYSGAYLILVQEGILSLSYNIMDDCDHELFEPDSARLLTAESLGWYMMEFERFSEHLRASLNSLHFFLQRKEGTYGED